MSLLFQKGQEGVHGEVQAVQLSIDPWESDQNEWRQRRITRSSQRGFTKCKSCLANLMSFCNEITSLMDKGGTISIVFLDSTKKSDTVPHKILRGKLLKHGLDEQCGGSTPG